MDRRRYVIIAVAAALLIAVLAGWLAFMVMKVPKPEPTLPAPPQIVVAPPVQPPLQPAPVQATLPDLAGRVLLGGCRQGECRWMRVVRIESVSTVPQGELRRLTVRSGGSRYEDEAPERYSDAVRVEWDAADHREYAFCSRDRPAYAFPDDSGGYILHYLDLFDLAGYQLASAQSYARICHDLDFDGDNAEPFRRLGYRPGTRNEQLENGRPEDMTRF
jgi:hypothetical protein